MRLSCACSALVGGHCRCANGLPIDPENETEDTFVENETNMDTYVCLDPALLSQDVSVHIGQDNISQVAQGARLFNRDNRTAQE